MKQETKVVLDTNVWISALLWGGKPAKIIKAAEQGRINILISEGIISEISQVLTYPKFKRIYQSEGLGIENLIETVLKINRLVNVNKKLAVVKEHPTDVQESLMNPLDRESSRPEIRRSCCSSSVEL